ncbi:hypothetical protein AVEN_18218-1 [Araneus ventricosus]|uniref:Uncharacterized protein n=1 Tax=Araneus ventricosus TaxID=182803 RepID=A0A4Y2AIX0_ARAVE|nr:hypothetical protein AVEN_18218-1 [Araneus ventricosus]
MTRTTPELASDLQTYGRAFGHYLRLYVQQDPYTADLQWNRASNREPSGPKAEALRGNHYLRFLITVLCIRTVPYLQGQNMLSYTPLTDIDLHSSHAWDESYKDVAHITSVKWNVEKHVYCAVVAFLLEENVELGLCIKCFQKLRDSCGETYVKLKSL